MKDKKILNLNEKKTLVFYSKNCKECFFIGDKDGVECYGFLRETNLKNIKRSLLTIGLSKNIVSYEINQEIFEINARGEILVVSENASMLKVDLIFKTIDKVKTMY